LNGIIVKWRQVYKKGITVSTIAKINTLLFADDRVIVADSEDNLQRGVFTLRNMPRNYELEISP